MNLTHIDELIEKFDHFEGIYRRKEMEEALTLKDEITPRLLGILETIIDDPERYAREAHFANNYAVALLAHFQEPAAHLPIIRAFCIPEVPREEIWGDMVTETLPILLVQTCNGQFDAIRALVADREAPEYVRGAAVDALTYAVAQGVLEREDVVLFLSGQFTGAEAGLDSDYWSNIASAISDIHPDGAMEVIRKAYADGLINPGYVALESIEEDMADSKEEVLARFQGWVDGRFPQDVHGYLSWFACFEKRIPKKVKPHVDCTHKAQQNKKKKNRAKNKQAKKARKKSRR